MIFKKIPQKKKKLINKQVQLLTLKLHKNHNLSSENIQYFPVSNIFSSEKHPAPFAKNRITQTNLIF